MTNYRGYQIKKVEGSRDVWFAILRNGNPVVDGTRDLTASTEYEAMQIIDKLAK